ncbi:LytR/AlgR family response regulator transcription factor [Rudanella lutea]|uniref:LytR/AlgR family response regulator transcription factor n=1 Tax=Rudanella lutea TaxID=451374 RepID=UPI000A040CBA|nr:LytTR family DNA-binding domain-containing protein [Rudanella lutea]
MMNVVLIEDEKPARKKLLQFIQQYPTPMEVLAELTTVANVTTYLQTGPTPDLIFSDIELLDGNVFEAFRVIAPPCPVVFTTAYQEFWLDAFGHSGIGYLLKPFDYEQFAKAVGQYETLRRNFEDKQRSLLQRLETWFGKSPSVSYATRFPVKRSDGIYLLETATIVYVKADGPVLKAIDEAGRTHLITDDSLSNFQTKLDPAEFFRINRSEIVQKRFIRKIDYYTKNTLALYFTHSPDCLITSQSQTANFKKWLLT